jgi:hypothetical protein
MWHKQEMRHVYRILVWKPEGKRPLRRDRGAEGMRWVGHVAQARDETCIQSFGVETLRKETTQKSQICRDRMMM